MNQPILSILGVMALASVLVGRQTPRTSPPAVEMPLVIRDVGIIAMEHDGVVTGTVAVRDGRITYVGPDAGAPATTGAHVVDGRGRFLIPGLIDLHTHVSKSRASSLTHFVAHGVTTVRDLGGDHEELLRWRAEIDRGERIGPRLLIAGPYLESSSNAARQHRTPASEMVEPVERTRVAVGSPADADRIVDALAARGVDHLKIRTTTDRATYLAIGAAARRHRLPLTGHAQPYGDADLIASGQASIEHQLLPTLAGQPERRHAHVRAIARAGIAVVPTLVVLHRIGAPSDGALAQAVADAASGPNPLAAFLRADWREQLAEQGPDRRAVYDRLRDATRRDLAALRAAGAPILAGSDAGVLNVPPGASLQQEVQLLVADAGMRPFEALRSASASAAALLGLAGEIGTIAPGKRADLVLLAANPLDDVGAVSRVAGVVLRGRYFDRAALDALNAQAATAPDITTNDWPRTPR